MVERSNLTIKRILYKLMYIHKTKNWFRYLGDVENAYDKEFPK